jgi:hypothetical protein
MNRHYFADIDLLRGKGMRHPIRNKCPETFFVEMLQLASAA